MGVSQQVAQVQADTNAYKRLYLQTTENLVAETLLNVSRVEAETNALEVVLSTAASKISRESSATINRLFSVARADSTLAYAAAVSTVETARVDMLAQVQSDLAAEFDTESQLLLEWIDAFHASKSNAARFMDMATPDVLSFNSSVVDAKLV